MVKLWFYAKDNRHPPLIVYEFSKSHARRVADLPQGLPRLPAGPIPATIGSASTGRSRKLLATFMRTDASWKQPIC